MNAALFLTSPSRKAVASRRWPVGKDSVRDQQSASSHALLLTVVFDGWAPNSELRSSTPNVSFGESKQCAQHHNRKRQAMHLEVKYVKNRRLCSAL